jgi:cytochrome P450
MPQRELPVFPFDIPLGPDVVAEYGKFRQECPVPKVRLATGGEAFLITRYEDARRMYDDPVFSRAACLAPETPTLLTGSKIPGVMLNMDMPEHTRLRKLAVQAFTTGAVARIRPRIEEIASELVDAMIEAGSPADFAASFGVPFPARVICEIIGVPSEDLGQVMNWLEHILSITRSTLEETATAFQELTAYCTELVAEKRRYPADDLITGLIQARDGGDRLTEEELVQLIWLHLGAGFETTANMLPNALLTLSRHPDQWALLREKPELVPGAVEELLRYVAVAQAGFERVAMADVELSGVPVPAGSVVLPLLNSVNFDADVFEEPERFDVTRSRNPHLGFGHGPHRCVGAPLGLVELEVALHTLLDRVPELRLAVPESELQWKQGMAVRALVRMPVSW